MATTLAKALQTLTKAQGKQHAPAERRRGKSSLLFSQAAASDIDLNSLYTLGTEGLRELARLDPRFNAFGDSLFGQAVHSFHRDKETAEVIKKLDDNVEAFLGVLSDHFLSPGCFKALEFLFRRFKIHACNVDAIIACALPYHGTNEFVRLVQCLALARSSCWVWLAPIQESGAALPREILVQRCINDQTVMKFVCSTAKGLGGRRSASLAQLMSGRTYLSFYAVTVCEVLAVTKIDEGLLTLLLPNISSGLGASANSDYRAATLMLVAELCTRSTLSLDFLNSMTSSLLQHMDSAAEQLRTVLLVLAHMASTQPQLTILPSAATKVLVSLPSLVSELASLSNAKVHVRPLLRLLTTSTAQMLVPPISSGSDSTPDTGSASAEGPLLEMVHANILSDVAKELAVQLLLAAPNASEVARPSVTKVLRALDLRYPEATDAAINQVLHSSTSHSKAAASDSEDDEDDVAGKDHRTAIFAFVKEAFALSAHAPCGDTTLTLAAAVSAPQSGVRIMALKQMSELLQDTEVSPESRAYAQSCILSAITDQDLDVATAVLTNADVLLSLPAVALLTALQSLLARTSLILQGPAKLACAKEARKAAKGALHMVALLASSGDGPASVDLINNATLLVLQYALPTQHAYRLCTAAIKAAAVMADVSPLMKSLADGATDAATAYATANSEEEGALETPSAAAVAVVETPAKSKKSAKKDKKQAEEEEKAISKGGVVPSTPGGLSTKLRKKLAAAAVDHAVVSSLGAAIAADPIERIPQVTSLMAGARAQGLLATQPATHLLHARHVLIMAMVRALHVMGTQSTAGGKKASAATAAVLSATTIPSMQSALMQLALLELAALPGQTNATAVAICQIDSWQATWAEMTEEGRGLPTQAHQDGVQSATLDMHAVTLCAALRDALQQVPAENSSVALPTLVELKAIFLSLTALRPAPAFLDHLRLLLVQGLPVGHAHGEGDAWQQLFLASFYASPGGPTAAKCAALTLQAEAIAAPATGKASKSKAGNSGMPIYLPHLLAALQSTEKEVRQGAVHCMEVLSAADSTAAAASAHVRAAAAALATHAHLLVADSDAVVWLLRNTFGSEASEASAPQRKSSRKSTAAGAKDETMSDAAGAKQDASSSRLDVSKEHAHALSAALCASLPQLHGSDSALFGARTLLSCLLMEDGSPADMGCGFAKQALELVQSLVSVVSPDSKRTYQVRCQVGSQLMRYLVTGGAQDAASRADVATLLENLIYTATSSAALASRLAPIRLAALQSLALNPSLLPLLLSAAANSDAAAAPLFNALIYCSSCDDNEACRGAAREILSACTLHASVVVVPVLTAAAEALSVGAAEKSEDPSQKSKKTKGADAVADEPALPKNGAKPNSSAADLAKSVHAATMVLELLQWKKDVQGPEVVVESCQDFLAALLPFIGTIAVSHGEVDDEEVAEEEGANGSAGSGRQSAQCGYAAQLVLAVLESVATSAAATAHVQADAAAIVSSKGSKGKKGKSAAPSVVECCRMELIVRVAEEAPDSAVRNAALSLLAVLAGLMPEQAVEHVLQVMSLLHHTSAVQEDEHSRMVVATALAAVVPAWLQAGKDVVALWESVVHALPGVPAHRRLMLLTSVMQAMPPQEKAALPSLLLLLLQQSIRLTKEMQASTDLPPSEWCCALAADMCSQAGTAVRLAALAELMESCVAVSEGGVHGALPKLSISFVATQLKARGVASNTLLVGLKQAEDPEVQSGCEALMHRALAVMQTLTQEQSLPEGGDAAAEAAIKKAQRGVRVTVEALYDVFEALQGVMASDTYLQALISLARQPTDKGRRRALKLFAIKTKRMPSELQGLSELLQGNKAKKERADQFATAVMLVCPLLGSCCATSGAGSDESTPLTRQAALLAVAAAATAFGTEQPAPLLQCLPVILSAASTDPNSSVRGSAMAAVAAIAHAVGTHMLPMLPATSEVVMQGARSALKYMAGSSVAAAGAVKQTAEAAEKAAKSGKKSRASKAAALSEPELEPVAEDGGVSEEAAIELCSALAAMDALVRSLGAFISPYLTAMLQLLLSPQVLSCNAGGCAQLAASMCRSLPTAVPARLLLEPLFAQLQSSVSAGISGVVALMDLVGSCATGMEAKVAATYHESIFVFLLRALDIRHLRPVSLAGHIHEAEQATLNTLVALVMKLSETLFRPMFLRLLEWASSTLSSDDEVGGGGAGRVARIVTLFGAANALTERLRSVFVPYYRYLLDLAVTHLGGSTAKTERALKKVKKAALLLESEWSPEQKDVMEEERALLRLRVVRALHRCFLYDSIGFLDQDRFERLLSPLVSQLDIEPTQRISDMLAKQNTDADLDATVTLGKQYEQYDTMGVALVGCLTQMAVDANSDVMWKPMNHQVLMMTRSASVRTKVLSIEVIAQLVDRLREEFLVLLPETIPFLAELLEDSELAVEARAQEVVKALEQVSGEKLDQYMSVK